MFWGQKKFRKKFQKNISVRTKKLHKMKLKKNMIFFFQNQIGILNRNYVCPNLSYIVLNPLYSASLFSLHFEKLGHFTQHSCNFDSNWLYIGKIHAFQFEKWKFLPKTGSKTLQFSNSIPLQKYCTLRPSETLLFSGLLMMIWQKTADFEK